MKWPVLKVLELVGNSFQFVIARNEAIALSKSIFIGIASFLAMAVSNQKNIFK